MKPKQKIVAETLEKFLCDSCKIDADGPGYAMSFGYRHR